MRGSIDGYGGSEGRGSVHVVAETEEIRREPVRPG